MRCRLQGGERERESGVYGGMRVYMGSSEEIAENKERPDVDKFRVTVLRRSFVCDV